MHYRIVDEAVILVGHTFPHKETLKGFGARFNGGSKVWTLPRTDANIAQVEAFCKTVGGGKLQEYSQTLERPIQRAEPEPAVVNQFANTSYTISQLLSKVSLAITEHLPRAVWVIGEIQNFSRKPSGCYFNLSEPKQDGHASATISIKATLWHSTLTQLDKKQQTHDGTQPLNQLLADGIKVRMLCQVGVYRDRGSISLNVLDIDPNYTKGALALAREAILSELRKLGLDRKNKQTFLTPFPFKVALVSADDSRAKGDFVDQLASYHFCGEVLFFAAQMQGERVVKDAIAALEQAVAAGCDVIILTRGGGSAADLRWFDDRDLAMAIAHCPLPVIAAIGHHEDICVAEEICFERQKTPTAAADFVISCFSKTQMRLDQLSAQLAKNLQDRVERFGQILNNLMNRISSQSQMALQRLASDLHSIDAALFDSFNAFSKHLEIRTMTLGQALFHRPLLRISVLAERLNDWEKRLIRLDPLPWIEQGWTQLFGPTNERLTSIAQVAPGDQVNARLKDGKLKLTVNEETEKETPR